MKTRDLIALISEDAALGTIPTTGHRAGFFVPGAGVLVVEEQVVALERLIQIKNQ